MKKLLFGLGVLLLLIIPIAIYANNSSFYLAEDEEYNANIYWGGESLEIQGKVNGDIFVVAGRVIINGQIKGDVVALTRDELVINGVVDGNVRALAGGDIKVNGEIKRALSVLAQRIYINDQAKIGATAMVVGREVEMRGNIAGNLDGFTESLFISGQLTHTNIEVSNLVLSPTAELRGNLNYKSVVEADIQEGAQVAGVTDWQPARVRDNIRDWNINYFSNFLLKFVSIFILGLVLIALAKKPAILVSKKLKEDLWKSVLWGLIFFVVAPLVAVILLFTIIGIPLAIILIIVYAVLLYIAKIYASLVIGKLIAKQFKWKLKWQWALLLGLAIYCILASLPFVGGLVVMLTMWWGVGGILQVKKDYLRPAKTE